MSIASDPKAPDFREHFWPQPEILGLTSEGIASGPSDGEAYAEVKPKFKREKIIKFGEMRGALTFKYDTKLYARLDFVIFHLITKL